MWGALRADQLYRCEWRLPFDGAMVLTLREALPNGAGDGLQVAGLVQVPPMPAATLAWSTSSSP